MTYTDPFLNDVRAEIQRATRKFPHQEVTLTLAEWFAVLTEEVGEVARDINDANFGDRFEPERLIHMREELVQVAAMAERMAVAVNYRIEGQLVGAALERSGVTERAEPAR